MERVLATGLWGLGLATIWIVTFSIGMGVPVALDASATGARPALPAGLVTWAIAGGAATLLAARAAGDAWPERLVRPLALLTGACAAGVAVEVTVMRWAIERFGAQAADPELIGWSTALAPMTVLVGLAALAATVLPVAARRFAVATTVAATAGVLLIVASNVPGAVDGITPLGIPMGIAMAAAALVAIAGVVVARPLASER